MASRRSSDAAATERGLSMAVFEVLGFDGFGYTIPVTYLTAATQEEADAFCARLRPFFPQARAFWRADQIVAAEHPVQVTSACPQCGQATPGYFCPSCACKVRKVITQRGG